ncbi:type II toxin-antitoxin system Phd/YefM family antitoxin [Granulicella sibirica]|uniref:Uncharacterized protein n=1 Tax=Granulicella sibirica TaxID=2479048 RepID=A0A4Q0T7D6_9BACT|nr:type II toxin-antitoxin system prevent-host-death family antitoxin [Granulicella sibirica]RXH58620.1 hypothetical protein GRAN_1930 [Granulicella sibirica]
MASWKATQAKAQFSAMLDRAETEGPQLVQRRNKTFVVLTQDELEAKRGRQDQEESGQSLWDFLRLPPEDGVDIEFPRLKSKARWVDFE